MKWQDDYRRASKNFLVQEFQCNCGECRSTGREMDEKVVNTLQNIRNELNKPIIVNRGFSCFWHNESIPGSATMSTHLGGLGCDIKSSDMDKLRTILLKKFDEGIITGLIDYGSYFHIDKRTTPKYYKDKR